MDIFAEILCLECSRAKMDGRKSKNLEDG